MIEQLQQLDASLLLTLNGFHSPFFDRFMMIFTGRFVWIPFYASLLLMLVKALGWRRALVIALATGLCVALADQICATLLRPIFCRPRPGRPDSPIAALVTLVDGYRGGHYGFPSCHGANSLALATAICLAVRVRRFTIAMLCWAAMNCYTRLYLGVHYPGDILTGALIGTLISLCIMIPLLRRLRPDSSSLRPFPSAADLPIGVLLASVAVIAIVGGVQA